MITPREDAVIDYIMFVIANLISSFEGSPEAQKELWKRMKEALTKK